MQNHQSSEIGSGGVVYCFHDRFLLLESVIVSILKGVYCLFFSRSTMSGNFPSDEVGKSYTHPVGRPKHFGRRQPRILYRLHPYAILLVHDKHPFTVRGKRAPTWEMQDHSKLGRMLLSGCSTRVLLAVPTWGKANSVEKNISFSSSSAYHLPRMKLKRHFFPTPNSLKRSNIATSPNYRI